jgi:hypothetical protein
MDASEPLDNIMKCDEEAKEEEEEEFFIIDI